MMVAAMVNAHMSLSCIEKNGVFVSNYCRTPCFSTGVSISLRPILRIKERNRIRVVTGYPKLSASIVRGLDNKMSGGEVLEKELGFKPSFGEYLKVMESVKTKRQTRKDNLKKKDDMLEKLNERDDKSVKIDTFEGQEQVLQVVKQDRLDKKSGGSVARDDFVEGKLGKLEKVIKKMDIADGVDVKGRETSYKLLNDAQRQETHEKRSNYQDIDGNEILRDSELENRVRWEHEGPIDNINSTRRSGKGLQDNRNPSRAPEPEGSFRKQVDLNGQKWILAGSEIHERYERDCIHDERFTHRKSMEREKFGRKNATSLGNGHGESLEMERVAFKTVNVSDVVDTPRVTKMEMEERIQKLAKSLNGADIDMPEWMFSQMMRSAKIRFSDHSIVRVIQVLGQLGNWRRVLQVIEWLQMRDRFKSHKLRFIYTTALNVLGKARRPVEALNVFHIMQQQMSSYPDLVAYRSIAVTLGQAGHMKELFDVIDCMRSPPKKRFKKGVLDKWDPRLEPDLIVYNAVLNACVKRKQWEGAFWVLQQLKNQDQQPSSTTYGLVMEVMLECGKYDLVHELFRKVQKSSIPNALTYKVLVNTLWREGKADEAVLVVNEMERRGIVGSAALYYDLARCLCSAGRCQEALLQIKKMSRVANKPLVVTYTGLIQACLDSGNTQDAAYIFGQMRGFCHPNLVTYNILLNAYSGHRMFEEAKELFRKMLEDGSNIRSSSDYRERVVPDTYTFNTMLDACVAEKSWQDFDYFYNLMLRHGYHFNAKRHLRMILDASKAGKVELVETTWKHLEQGDRLPPLPLVLERFCIKVENNEFSSAVSCITAVCDGESQGISRAVWLKMFKDNAQRFKQESLDGLVDEVTGIIGRSGSPNIALRDLLVSCKEFLKTHKISYCTSPTTKID